MKDIITATLQQLKTVNGVKYVAEDYGQLDFAGVYPVKFPAVLVAPVNFQYETLLKDPNKTPQLRQQAVGEFEFAVAVQMISKANAAAPAQTIDNALAIWDIVQGVHEKIQGFQPVPYSGAFVRKSIITERNDSGLKIVRITYDIGLHDV